MLLHTIVTAEMIFPAEPVEMKVVQIGEDFAECYEKDGKLCLSRLISTDPKKFLDKRYTIGGEFLT